MISDTGLSDVLMTEIVALAKKRRICRLVLFGSRARGDYRRTSDIDLAVSGGDIAGFIVEADEVIPTLLHIDDQQQKRSRPAKAVTAL